MNPLLEVKDVCLSYHSLSGETAALSHISFHLMPEEFLAVVGPSGCGKSTLLNLICGLLHAESGTILINGKPLNKDSARIGYMLQKDHLLEWRSIYRNVLLGLEIQGELTKDNLSYVDELLKIYELDKFRDSRPSQLSGGMRQRAALIRTLVLKPDLLLLDEPFSALDYQTRLNVSDDIGKILKKKGLIKDAKIFVVQEKLSSYKGKLQAGTYILNTSMTPDEMMAILARENTEGQPDQTDASGAAKEGSSDIESESENASDEGGAEQ